MRKRSSPYFISDEHATSCSAGNLFHPNLIFQVKKETYLQCSQSLIHSQPPTRASLAQLNTQRSLLTFMCGKPFVYAHISISIQYCVFSHSLTLIVGSGEFCWHKWLYNWHILINYPCSFLKYFHFYLIFSHIIIYFF